MAKTNISRPAEANKCDRQQDGEQFRFMVIERKILRLTRLSGCPLSCFHWYKKCKNPLRNVGVMVQNKVSRVFIAHGVYFVIHRVLKKASIVLCLFEGV